MTISSNLTGVLDSAAIPAYKNASLPVKKRVADLVSKMTLPEKVSQMVFNAPAIAHLDIPAYNWWNEGLHGLGRAGVATVFPQAIGLAAMWNPELVGYIAEVIATEARAKHHAAIQQDIRAMYTGLTIWSPNINIFRDPRWGRGQETYGEDPYLTGRLGVAFVKGLQGDHPDYLRVVATPKHFAVHSGPESDRHYFDAVVNERDLRETYLPAFEVCVKEGGAVSIMGAYNRTNGEPCCASWTLLRGILRQEWGFEGFVVSDCEAILDIYAHHKTVATAAEAASMAVKNGCELNCGCTYSTLVEAVEAGLITEATIDEAVSKLLKTRFRLGMFDSPETDPYAHIPYQIINSLTHKTLALTAARQATVLLKNKGGLLPLSKSLKSIAVIGPNADSLAALLGNYHGTPEKATTHLEGIRQKISPDTALYYAPGCNLAEGIPHLTVIPTEYLRATTGDLQHGLTASYYKNAHFESSSSVTQVDPKIDFTWKDTTPSTGEWGAAFTVRWQGHLVAPVSGRYTLGVSGHNGYKLYVDEVLCFEHKDVHHPVLKTEELDLEAGRSYALQLDYVNEGLDPQIQLLWARPDVDYEAEALAIAEKAAVIVAVLGLSPGLEGEEMPIAIPGFSGGDRTDITLPCPQKVLLQKLHALGKPVVLVLANGSALAINWAAENIPAILTTWYSGEAGGQALADILFGDYNPAGRLPITFYKSVDDLPPFSDYNMAGRTYRYFEGEVLFPFGHGLSYTTFALSHLHVSQTTLNCAEAVSVEVKVEVSNLGSKAGDEVVQLYVQHLQTSVPQPLKTLKGFKRLTLQSGETKTVTFILTPNDLGYYNQEMIYSLHPGQIALLVGHSSQNLPLQRGIEVM